jgi:hypothetical protein
MEFKEATDRLVSRVLHEDLAAELGVSIQTIRQARLSPDSASYRKPPRGWERAVMKLATRHVIELGRLVLDLRAAQRAGGKLPFPLRSRARIE